MDLRILGGGVAKGLVGRLTSAYRTDTGHEIVGEFGAVGGMRDRVAAGEAVDVVILTRALMEGLAEAGHLDASSLVDLGQVVTGIAVPDRDASVDVSTPEALRAALTGADAIYISDPQKATAGRHFMEMVGALGIAEEIADRLLTHASGHIGMAAMADGDDRQPIGCTQLPEIAGTKGVRYCGALPEPYALVTTYTAALATRSAEPAAGQAFLSLLMGPAGGETRKMAGFVA